MGPFNTSPKTISMFTDLAYLLERFVTSWKIKKIKKKKKKKKMLLRLGNRFGDRIIACVLRQPNFNLLQHHAAAAI